MIISKTKKIFTHIKLLFNKPEHSYFFRFIPLNFILTKFRTARQSLKMTPYKVIFQEPYAVKPPEASREILDFNVVRHSNRFPILPEVFLDVIPQGIIYTHYGTIGDSENFLLLESHKTLDDFASRSAFRKLRCKINNSRFIHENCTTILTEMGHGYGHFLLDHLPRFYALQFFEGNLSVLLPDSLMPVLKELCEIIRPDNCELIFVSNEHAAYRCKNVVLSPFTTIGSFGYHRKEIVDYIDKKVDAYLAKNSNNQDRQTNFYEKVYVTRRLASYGKIANEQELIGILQERGFAIIDLETLSLYEQIELFRNVRFLCGAQTSGFANLIFSNPGTALLQLLWKKQIETPSLGLYDYGTAISRMINYFPYVVEHNTSIRTPAVVDINHFINNLDEILDKCMK